MARLLISLFGPFQAIYADRIISDFRSKKARALFAYLTIEAGQAHQRLFLATLLWPEASEHSALTSLRSTLVNLRKVVGDLGSSTPSYLLITRETVQFNPSSDTWLDVAEFERLIELSRDPANQINTQPTQIRALQKAVALRRGEFLEGFSIGDSDLFEDWLFHKRRNLNILFLETLSQLATYYERRGDFESAAAHRRRQIEIEPWNEEAHQQLMRSLALAGMRSAALNQYDICQRFLAKELDVKPSGETNALYAAIRDGKLTFSSAEQFSLAGVDFREGLDTAVEAPLVGRSRELGQLEAALQEALSGRGRPVFVTGSPGSGKSTLIRAFIERAVGAHRGSIAAFGSCDSYTGAGDPCLPFLEIMAMLGDTEAKPGGSSFSTLLADRARTFLPILLIEAVNEVGPDLVNRFIDGEKLYHRGLTVSRASAPRMNRLERLIDRERAGLSGGGLQQADLFEQYRKVILYLARRHPVLVVIDDLQWADEASINLFFHIGRNLIGSRILMIGAYRPEEIAFGRGGERHPLEPILHELQREYGEPPISLDASDGQEFVEALLDSEANHLDKTFRHTLLDRTGGHPLFTVELLRGFKERGELVRDEAGSWDVGPTLNWDRIPARVEAVIAERVGRLAPELRRLLEAASVEGEEFTAEVLAMALSSDEEVIVRQLSDILERKHRLVLAQQFRRAGGRRISRYRFQHYLFQSYLYMLLDPVEKAYLHEAIGKSLERLYQERAEESASSAVQLARHFQEAEIFDKAIHYLGIAGERASRLSATEEAILHWRCGLELCEQISNESQRNQLRLELLMGLGSQLMASRGYSSKEVEQVYAQAYKLCQARIPSAGDAPGGVSQLIPILFALSTYYGLRAQYKTAIAINHQIYSLAQTTQNPQWVSIAQWGYGWLYANTGDFLPSIANLEQVLDRYDPQEYRWTLKTFWQEIGVSCLSWYSWVLLARGFPDQARQQSAAALELARQIDHPFTLAFALGIATMLRSFLDDVEGTRELAEECISMCRAKNFPFWLGIGTTWHGWVLYRSGECEAGIAQMQAGIRIIYATGAKVGRTSYLGLLSEALREAGRLGESLKVLEEAIEALNESGEGYAEPELFGVKGDLAQNLRDENEAEAWYRKAMELARKRGARFWELRAAVKLGRLLVKQNRREEARQSLAEIVNEFKEGFDCQDLLEAVNLLEEIS